MEKGRNEMRTRYLCGVIRGFICSGRHAPNLQRRSSKAQDWVAFHGEKFSPLRTILLIGYVRRKSIFRLETRKGLRDRSSMGRFGEVGLAIGEVFPRLVRVEPWYQGPPPPISTCCDNVWRWTLRKRTRLRSSINSTKHMARYLQLISRLRVTWPPGPHFVQ